MIFDIVLGVCVAVWVAWSVLAFYSEWAEYRDWNKP